MEDTGVIMAFGRPGILVGLFLLCFVVAGVLAAVVPQVPGWLRVVGGIAGGLALIAGFLIHAWRDLVASLLPRRKSKWDSSYMDEGEP